MDQGIKSRPRYERLHVDPEGKRHLILTDHGGLPAGAFATDPSGCEIWSVNDGNGHAADARSFAAPDALLAALRTRLTHESAGLRVYAVGTEAFIWDAEAICREAGMGKGEIFLAHAGSLQRRVWCAHCATITERVTTSIVSCPGCGASLFVRDHFSRRLRAFMGVQVDAEIPGEIPPAAELYP